MNATKMDLFNVYLCFLLFRNSNSCFFGVIWFRVNASWEGKGFGGYRVSITPLRYDLSPQG